VSTDAHSAENFENLPYGVATAQRGWLEKEHVLNASPVDDLLAYK
jgi:DNA polymerase (family 10)